MREIFAPPQSVPIRCWAEPIDELALRQLKKLARWDRFGGPIAAMPDLHFSENLCVGTVLATEGVILPSAIGHDLGCGMCCAALNLHSSELRRVHLEDIVARVFAKVPTGRRVHDTPQMVPSKLNVTLSTKTLTRQREWLGTRHFGTLGGGNHFIELQRDPTGGLWITVHSGSRGVGGAIATHHTKAAIAKSSNESAPLPFFESDSVEARAFLSDLSWALTYAEENRKRMLEETIAQIAQYLGAQIEATDIFDVPHNLISVESHGSRELFIHRKGAMPAHAGVRGIIPGSMGTASYIVEGLGASESFASCSHGAGRKLSRNEARRRISIKELRRQMSHVVYPREVEQALIEECPAVYKDIKEVLRQQSDLVRPLLRLEPIAVAKGE